MFDFLPGDILFQDIECGPVCDAISGVTLGYLGAHINHCGIYGALGGKPRIFEAIYPKVAARPPEEFLVRSTDAQARPRVLVGRLKGPRVSLIPKAIDYCSSSLGKPYDSLFDNDQTALYCSELVVDAFRSANQGVAVFPERPMRFRDPVTGEISAFWVKYYQQFGRDVPDGEPGSNPADLSNSKELSIVAQLGDLGGLPLHC